MLLWLFACSTPTPPPLIEARGGGAGYWPPHSATAVTGAIELGFDGLEVDLVMTRDEALLLWPDPWLSVEGCTHTDGSPLAEPFLIQNLDLHYLSEEIRCGGSPDPAYPNALVVAEAPMSFSQLLGELREGEAFHQRIHLHIQQRPGLTPGAERFAEATLQRWLDADLPQELHISADRGPVIEAFEASARRLGFDVQTTLRLDPERPSDTTSVGEAVWGELGRSLGTTDPLALAVASRADGIGLAWSTVDRQLVDRAIAEGLQVQIGAIEDPRILAQLERWPLDSVLADYPGDAAW